MVSASHDDKEILGYLQEICHHWGFHDKQWSYELIKLIVEGIDRSDLHRVGTFLSMMGTLLSIDEDNCECQTFRFDKLFNCDNKCIGDARINAHNLKQRLSNRRPHYAVTIDVFDLIHFYTEENKDFAYKCIEVIIKLVKKYPHFAKLFIQTRNNRWKHWDLWLKEYCFGMHFVLENLLLLYFWFFR